MATALNGWYQAHLDELPPALAMDGKFIGDICASLALLCGGEPLRDYEAIVNLIARTTTAAGLKVTCRQDRRKYATGRRISNEAMPRVRLVPAPFHGEWNFTIHPATKRKL